MLTASRFKLFYSRNIQWYFSGHIFSLIGSWFQYIALGWLMYHLTHSGIFLGAVSLVGGLPLLLCPPIFGHFIDHTNKKKLLLLIQILFFFQATILGCLTITSNINYQWILFLSLLHGVLFSIDQPLRQTLLPSLIEHENDLASAIAWNAFINNFARILAPSLAGLVIMIYGEGFCFFADAASFLVMAFVISRLRFQKTQIKKQMKFWESWRESRLYISNSPAILSNLWFAFLFSATICTYTSLMPIIVQSIFRGDATTQGYFITISGIGAVLSSFLMTKMNQSLIRLTINIGVASFISIIVLTIFVFNSQIILGLILLGLLGACIMVCTISINTLLQLIVVDDKRACVMSLYTTAFLGAVPLSNFMAGFLAEYFGIQMAILILTAICLIGLFFYLFLFSKKSLPLLKGSDSSLSNTQ